MVSTITDIYRQLADDPKLIRKWQHEVNRRVRRFIRNVAGASPFLDKPAKRMFGVRNSKDGESLTFYGTSPNAGRMKSFDAPTNEWRETVRTFRIFGRAGWRTIHKTQMVRVTAGTPIQDVPYFGTSEKPKRYFGIKKGKTTLAYGRTDSGIALPVYAQDSYPDWIMNNHREEIDDIILRCGQDVLAEYIAKGGLK